MHLLSINSGGPLPSFISLTCILKLCLFLYPHHKMWGGGYTGFALSRRSVGPSVSNLCPLYNSFTNGKISFKLE